MYLSGWDCALGICCWEDCWLQKTEKYIKQIWTESNIWSQAHEAQTRTMTPQLSHRNETKKQCQILQIAMFWGGLLGHSHQATDTAAQPVWASLDTPKFNLLSLASKAFYELAAVSSLSTPECQPLFTPQLSTRTMFSYRTDLCVAILSSPGPSLFYRKSVQVPLFSTGRTLLSPHVSAPNQPCTQALKAVCLCRDPFRPLTSSVALSEFFSFSEPQFPHSLLHSLVATGRNEVSGTEPGTSQSINSIFASSISPGLSPEQRLSQSRSCQWKNQGYSVLVFLSSDTTKWFPGSET